MPPPRKLSGLQQGGSAKTGTGPLALGALVISNVVTPLDLAVEDQNLISGEIKWLFSAIDHLLKLYNGEINRSQPIGEPIPPEAETIPEANNQLLDNWHVDNLNEVTLYFSGTSTLLSRLDVDLNRMLKPMLDQETHRGEAGKGDPVLQEQIKDRRVRIVETVQQAAEEINKAYGVLVSSPGQLRKFLEEHVNPIALGSQIIAKVITQLGLEADDERFVTGEIQWLFSAADNYQQLYQALQQRLTQEKNNLKEAGLPLKSRTGELSKRLPPIRQAVIAGGQPLVVVIPPDAQKSPEATNRLINFPDNDDLSFYFDVRSGITYGPQESNVKSLFNRITSALQNLDGFIQRETQMGEEGQRNVNLQNDIRQTRIQTIVPLQEIAEHMNKAYGILVTTPDQLTELLESQGS
jgi:hypothetical protein